MGFPLKQIVHRSHKKVPIRCPRPGCAGFGVFDCVQTNFGQIEGNLGEPLKCGTCKKFMRIKIGKIIFDAAPVEVEPKGNPILAAANGRILGS